MQKEKHQGEALERFLKNEKISITDLSDKIGISRSAVYNWFKMAKINFENLQKIKKELGVDFLKIETQTTRKEIKLGAEDFIKEGSLNSEISITINLDGTSEKLEFAIKRLIDLNTALKK